MAKTSDHSLSSRKSVHYHLKMNNIYKSQLNEKLK